MTTEDLSGDLSWPKLHKHLSAEIDRLRALNDDVSLDPVKTAALRGEIKALKDLRDLPAMAAHKRAIGRLQLPDGED